jgi:hypothetical protein
MIHNHFSIDLLRKEEINIPLTFVSYRLGSLIRSAAASPLRGSVGLGYLNSCGKNTSKIFIMSYIGDQV